MAVIEMAVHVTSSSEVNANQTRIVSNNVDVTASTTIDSTITRIISNNISVVTQSSITSNLVKIVSLKSNVRSQSSVNVRQTRIISAGSNIRSTSSITAKIHKFRTMQLGVVSTSEVEVYRIDRDIYKEILKDIPSTYANTKIMHFLFKLFSNELTRLLATAEWVAMQINLDTASLSELDRREVELGLPIGSSLDRDTRVKRIRRRMVDPDVTTQEIFESSMNSFYVNEYIYDPDNLSIQTKILSKRGIPENIEEMKRMENEIVPGHIEHAFEYTYLPWDEIEEVELTWDAAEALGTWDEFESTFLIPFEKGE